MAEFLPLVESFKTQLVDGELARVKIAKSVAGILNIRTSHHFRATGKRSHAMQRGLARIMRAKKSYEA